MHLNTRQKVWWKIILVQQQCLPNSLLGVDVLCQAKAGVGKTAVFVLTILNTLSENAPMVSFMVLAPTRELSLQVSRDFERFSTFLNFKTQMICGGEDIDDQIDNLKKNKPAIIVGCPGRVLSLIRRKELNLSNNRYFVLDECDKMLKELDMRSDVQAIFKATPTKKQVMMFSATLKEDIRVLCKKFMKKVFNN